MNQPKLPPLLEPGCDRIYGPAHPDVIGATFALGVALLKSAAAKAKLLLRQAIANWRLSQAEQHPHMTKFLNVLATSRYAQEDHRGAGILSEQALRMSRDIFGTEHPYVIAQCMSTLNFIRREVGRIRALIGYSEPDRRRIDILALRRRRQSMVKICN